MQRYGIGEKEMAMAKLLWAREGIRSMEVIKLCAEEFGWAKSTTFTMLRRLCDHGLFQNVNSVVTSVMSEDDYRAKVATDFVDDKFNGSLPEFVGTVIKNKGLSEADRAELFEMVRSL